MISVIMPTYNRSKTIKRAIDSVLNQTYSDIELIIVDDCSSDNTDEIVSLIKDNRIKYYKLESNRGACFARNYGISKACGNYIAFQDADDEWISNKLEVQISNIDSNKSDMDFCDFIRFDDSNFELLPSKKTKKVINKLGVERALRYGNFISTQLLLIRKECLDEIKFDVSLPRLQDYDLVLQLSSKYKFSYSAIPLAIIYVQGDSISKSFEKLNKAIEIMLRKKYLYQNTLYSTLYLLLAKSSTDKESKRNYYKKALRNRFTIKTIIKLLINY